MKLLPIFLALLAIGSGASQAGANPRGLGPSAIEAARLKYYPPGGYLSHYLPDDRYKIAGNVWKYVSTDLDTYYHVPSSPNMMRQPADRVIGFASAADAEEAGYSADPSDGTGQIASVRMQSPSVGRGSVEGENAKETAYLNRVVPLLTKAQSDATALGQQFSATMQRSQGRGQQVSTPVVMRQMMTQLLGQTRSTVRNFERLRPPARFRRFHSLLAQTLRDSNTAVYALNRMTVTGNFGTLMAMQGQFKRMQTTQLQLHQEISRLGLDSQMGMIMHPTLPRR